MKFFNFKKKNKNEKSEFKKIVNHELSGEVKKKSAKLSKRNMIKAARAARRARAKASVQKRPFTRVMSLILAGVMLFGFVSGAGMLIWNFFFPPKREAADFGDFDMQAMLDSLSKLKDQQVGDEEQPVDEDGEAEDSKLGEDESESSDEGENKASVENATGSESEEKQKAANVAEGDAAGETESNDESSD